MLLFKNFAGNNNPLYEFFPKNSVPPEKEIHLALQELLGHPNPKHAQTAAKLLSLCTAYGENRIRPQGTIHHSHQIYFHYCERMRVLRQEVLVAILLDSLHHLETEVLITVGTFWDNSAQMQEVLLPVLERRAKKFILVHNHPIGEPIPTQSDITATKRVEKAAEVFDIQLLDHIIIGKDAYYSLKAKALFTHMDAGAVRPPVPYGLMNQSTKQKGAK